MKIHLEPDEVAAVASIREALAAVRDAETPGAAPAASLTNADVVRALVAAGRPTVAEGNGAGGEFDISLDDTSDVGIQTGPARLARFWLDKLREIDDLPAAVKLSRSPTGDPSADAMRAATDRQNAEFGERQRRMRGGR